MRALFQGTSGADMKISLVDEGPATIRIHTETL